MSEDLFREPDTWGADDDHYRTTKKSKAAGVREERLTKAYYGARAAVLNSWNESPNSIGLSLLKPIDLSVVIHQFQRDGSWNAAVVLRRDSGMMWWVYYNALTRHTTVTNYKKTTETVLYGQEKEN